MGAPVHARVTLSVLFPPTIRWSFLVIPFLITLCVSTESFPSQIVSTYLALNPNQPRVEREQVVSGPGSTLSLSCLVQGNPTPMLHWYFADSKVIHSLMMNARFKSNFVCCQVRPNPMLGIEVTKMEDKHTLTISKTSVATFGNYSCVAKNSLGTFKKHIEVR